MVSSFFKGSPSAGLPQWYSDKNLPANAGYARDVGSIHESGRSSGGGIGNPLQYSCLGNPMVRGTRWATVMGSQRVRYDWGTDHHNTTTCWTDNLVTDSFSPVRECGRLRLTLRLSFTFRLNFLSSLSSQALTGFQPWIWYILRVLFSLGPRL